MKLNVNSMVASLPVYDFPQIREATDSIWQRTREYLLRQGIDAPRKLNRSQDGRDLWNQPNLLLSQTCGCPYRRYIHDKVHLVGTPDIDLECPSGYYYSCLIVRAGTEYNDRCWESLAYNDDNSQSGWVAPLAHARRSGIRIEEFHQTGSHWESAKAVASGRSSIAAIDVSTWRIMCMFAPFRDNLFVTARTEATPGLPFITSRYELAERLFEAFNHAIAVLTEDERGFLPYHRLVKVGKDEYLRIQDSDQFWERRC